MSVLKKPQYKYLVTRVKPTTRFDINGPCKFDVRPINEFGEVVISFELPENVYIDKYKINYRDVECKKKDS